MKKAFVIHGPGGSGKSFLAKHIINASALKSEAYNGRGHRHAFAYYLKQVPHDTSFILIDDLNSIDFIESLVPVFTQGFVSNQKYRPAVHINPQFVFTLDEHVDIIAMKARSMSSNMIFISTLNPVIKELIEYLLSNNSDSSQVQEYMPDDPIKDKEHKLRLLMGAIWYEVFTGHFYPRSPFLNSRIDIDKFIKKIISLHPNFKAFCTRGTLKNHLKQFCIYQGFDFNLPTEGHRMRNGSKGIEYFVVSDDQFDDARYQSFIVNKAYELM